MPTARLVLYALRVAALWLLVVSVFFGPAGFGGSVAWGSVNNACGVSCPCDADGLNELVGEHAQTAPLGDSVAGDSNQHEADACKDECPDSCPNCDCSLGMAMAVFPLPGTDSTVSYTSLRRVAPVEVPASGACTGVFRPPRSGA